MSPTLCAAGCPPCSGHRSHVQVQAGLMCKASHGSVWDTSCAPPDSALVCPASVVSGVHGSLTPLYPHQGLVHDPNSPPHPDLISEGVWAQPHCLHSLVTSTSKGSGLLALPAPLPVPPTPATPRPAKAVLMELPCYWGRKEHWSPLPRKRPGRKQGPVAFFSLEFFLHSP